MLDDGVSSSFVLRIWSYIVQLFLKKSFIEFYWMDFKIKGSAAGIITTKNSSRRKAYYIWLELRPKAICCWHPTIIHPQYWIDIHFIVNRNAFWDGEIFKRKYQMQQIMYFDLASTTNGWELSSAYISFPSINCLCLICHFCQMYFLNKSFLFDVMFLVAIVKITKIWICNFYNVCWWTPRDLGYWEEVRFLFIHWNILFPRCY